MNEIILFLFITLFIIAFLKLLFTNGKKTKSKFKVDDKIKRKLDKN